MTQGELIVSVVVVNRNHGHMIGACLDALRRQDAVPFDVTVVDNASTDGSARKIAIDYPEVRLICLDQNEGFSIAFNQAARESKRPYVLSLNPDVVVQPGFLERLVRAIEAEARLGSVVPKLLQAQNTAVLDSTGLFVDRRRCPYDRGQGEPDVGQYDHRRGVFGACGAAALYRRVMLDDVACAGEYFDEDFFAYCEDADLSWRARLRDWRCQYVPEAVATHARGLGDSLRKPGRARKSSLGPRLALRNRYAMTVKNDGLRYVAGDLPTILGSELVRLAYATLTRPAVLLGLCDLARILPRAVQKRRFVRGRALVGDSEIRRWFIAPDGAAEEEV
jgi:GT2 family glycosyltransferase